MPLVSFLLLWKTYCIVGCMYSGQNQLLRRASGGQLDSRNDVVFQGRHTILVLGETSCQSVDLSTMYLTWTMQQQDTQLGNGLPVGQQILTTEQAALVRKSLKSRRRLLATVPLDGPLQRSTLCLPSTMTFKDES